MGPDGGSPLYLPPPASPPHFTPHRPGGGSGPDPPQAVPYRPGGARAAPPHCAPPHCQFGDPLFLYWGGQMRGAPPFSPPGSFLCHFCVFHLLFVCFLCFFWGGKVGVSPSSATNKCGCFVRDTCVRATRGGPVTHPWGVTAPPPPVTATRGTAGASLCFNGMCSPPCKRKAPPTHPSLAPSSSPPIAAQPWGCGPAHRPWLRPPASSPKGL